MVFLVEFDFYVVIALSFSPRRGCPEGTPNPLTAVPRFLSLQEDYVTGHVQRVYRVPPGQLIPGDRILFDWTLCCHPGLTSDCNPEFR